MRTLILPTLFALASIAAPAAHAVEALVLPDQPVFRPGQPVGISVYAVNPGSDPAVLHFPDGRVADYVVDEAYTWSDDKAFTMAPETREVPAGGRLLLHRFEHDESSYPLAPGPHRVRGVVPGYGEDAAVFTVAQDDSTDPPPPYELLAEVDPAVVPFGEPVDFSLTVTNTSGVAATFGVDGCPVHYVLDGVFRPQWGCPEFWKLITLEPGQGRTWTPAEFPALRHESRTYPLGPGEHTVALFVPDIGIRAFATFTVEEPNPDLAHLSGRVTGDHGQPLYGARVLVEQMDPKDEDDVLDRHELVVGDAGYWLLSGVRPGSFVVSARLPNRVLWFPDADRRAGAEAVHVRPGQYRNDLDISFGTPPPDSLPVLTGVVMEVPDVGLPVPVEGAKVVAVRLTPDVVVEDGAQPPDRETLDVVATTDGTGRFTMRLERGAYRVLAGKYPTHQYLYSGGAARWESAPVHRMAPGDELFLDFYLPTGFPEADPVLTGQVLAFDPVTDGLPEPLADATVQAFPILPVPLRALLLTGTGEDGRFELPVWPTTPYRVWFHKDGYYGSYFEDGQDARLATPVDTEPGRITPDVNVVLQPRGNEPGRGALTGRVFRRGPFRPDGGCTTPDCVEPAAGALVRVEAAFPTFAPYVITTRTDDDGSWAVRGLTSDGEGTYSYYVSAELPDFERAYAPGGVPFPRAEPVPVFDGRPVDVGPITLGRTDTGDEVGHVGGRVIAARGGAGIPGALVRVYLAPHDPAGPVRVARTDAEGHWFLERLPHPARVLVSAEAPGFVPGYHGGWERPTVHRWRAAALTPTGGPAVDILPVELPLAPAANDGPFLQAGRVRVVPGVNATSDGPLTPRLRALQYHRGNVSRAFFYVVNSRSAAPVERPVAGITTGDNGVAVITGLPEGVYFAYADRPGYESAYFVSEAGGRVPLVLNPNTPAVLADIVLRTNASPPADDDGSTPRVTGLTNAPNPFQPRTTIHYRLMADESVSVTVYDFRGRLVRRLVTGTLQPAGPHEVDWDATDERGRRVAAGVYFFRIDAGGSSQARKMVLLP